MDRDKIIETIIAEKSDLRQEMKHLKDCQLRYFSIAVTVTGVLIGVGSRLLDSRIDTGHDYVNELYIAILMIVIPCWWIFFDKATTISRIVAYYRIIEFIISDREHNSWKKYLGWERSLAIYREKEPMVTLGLFPISRENWNFQSVMNICIQLTKDFLRIVSMTTTQRYWIINMYTYTTLAFSCLILYKYHNGDTIYLYKDVIYFANNNIQTNFFLFSTCLCLISLIYNLVIVRSLIFGKYSYKSNQQRWCKALNIDPSIIMKNNE